MAMDVGGAKGGVKSDINVTPLVDVMLVLLIIMMLVAPMLQQGVPMTLPTAVNSTRSRTRPDQTVVFVDRRRASSTSTRLRPTRQDDVPKRLKTSSREDGEDRLPQRATRTRRTAPS